MLSKMEENLKVLEYMLNRGYITKDELSAQGMKRYLDKNPFKMDEVLNQNESYVFFQKSNKVPQEFRFSTNCKKKYSCW